MYPHFFRLGGKYRRSFVPSLVQTDGSFYSGKRSGFVAALLHHNDNIYKQTVWLETAEDSCETEWASVYNGIIFSLNKQATQIHIENDNLGVVESLIATTISPKQKKRREKEYATYYRHAILSLVKQTNYAAIRWIPREQNRADDLFR